MSRDHDHYRELWSEYADDSDEAPRPKLSPGKRSPSSLIGSGSRGHAGMSPGKRSSSMQIPTAADSRAELPYRAEMEAMFGEDFSGVEVTTGAATGLAPLGARAAAQGDAIAFGPTAPAPELVAHELTHVVQQRRAGTTALAASKEVSQRGDPAEREAESIAAHVSRHGLAAAPPVQVSATPTARVHLDEGDAPSAQAPRPIAAEASILAILHRAIDVRDASGLRQRVADLTVLFEALPSADRAALRDRLRQRRRDDELATAFHYRLATPTRNRLMRKLEGESTPLPAAHDSIEPDAFVAGLEEAAIVLDPEQPRLAGYEATLVTASVASSLSPPEGHTTEVAWHLLGTDAAEYGSGRTTWPAHQPGPLELDLLEVMAGRTALTVEIVVDGAVRRILRKLIEVGPGASPGVKDVPGEVIAHARAALATPIPIGRDGEPDHQQLDDVLRELATIMPSHRAALVEQLSAPAENGSLAALFLANVPATVRSRVIAVLSGGHVEASPDALEADIGGKAYGLEVSPRRPVIAPWMDGSSRVEVRPQDPFSSEAVGLPADGPALDVYWSVVDELGQPVLEQRTAWQEGRMLGEPLAFDAPGPGNYQVTAHVGQAGLVGQTISTEVVVAMEADSDLAAAERMGTDQLRDERASVREQMTDGNRTAAGQDELWMRAAALDAGLAAAGGKESPPSVSDAEHFAPDSWINHTAPGANPPVSTNRTHIRYLLEQRFRLPDMSTQIPLHKALESYINDGKTEAENRTRARTIHAIVKSEHEAMLKELTSFQDAFARKGQALCLKLLAEGRRDVLDRQREYGFSAGADAETVADNIDALAFGARELLGLQKVIAARKEKVADLERQMNDAQGQWAADADNIAALERSEELRQVLMGEQDAVIGAEQAFLVRKGELVGEFPVLAIANTGDPAKQAMSQDVLRRISRGDLGDVSSKLAETLGDIAKVEEEVNDNEDVVWGIPQLLAITKDSLGITPQTFQARAISNKLLDIKAGVIIKVVSQIGTAVLATILTFGAAGPLVFAMDAAMFAQDIYEVSKSIEKYRFEEALKGTHYDQAKALSQDDPSTFWLAFEIVMTLVSAGDAVRAAKGLNQARKVFGEVRAARKAVATVSRADDIGGKLDEIANVARARGLSDDVQRRLRREALEELAARGDEVGDSARRLLSESDDFAARAASLSDSLRQQAAALGEKAPPDFELEVLSKAEFETRFGSKKGRAVFTMNDGKPKIFARYDASPLEVADEAAHLVQLGDPKLASDLKYLDEANLDDWKSMSVSDKLEFYQRKLDVEIDAKQRTIATLTDPDELDVVRRSLDDLQALQADVASITPDQLARMNAGTLKEPPFLDQPARAFQKTRVGNAPRRPDLNQVDPNAPKPSTVSRSRKNHDYSTAYGDNGVSEVLQQGKVWEERVIVTTGYAGKVKSIKSGKKGTKVISIETDSGRVQQYVLEAGAEIPDEIKKAAKSGEKIDKDTVLGREVPREYRWVEVRYGDGRPPTTRAEIKRTGKDGGWVQRGSESTERGAAAEAAAMGEADEALAAAKQAGEIGDFARLPHQVGGGGFDDVIVEFVGTGKDMRARIRIREVKDYPNRHVPLSEFTALNDNWQNNFDELVNNVQDALAGSPPRGYETLSKDQLRAIQRKLSAEDFEVEIRLGDTTRLGDPGHHSSTTLPALEATVGKKINVKKIGEGDR